MDCEKLLAEKDAKIKELEEKVRELESKLMKYELREVYRDIIPEDVLEEFLKLPPEKMVVEIGKYLKQIGRVGSGGKPQKVEDRKVESGEVEEGIIRARVGVDLAFTKYDFEGSDVMFLAKDIAERLGVNEGQYVTVRKNGSVNLRAIIYDRDGFVVLPSWVKEKIGAKVNDFVEIVRR
ncbi:MAG: hypothetical protein ABWW66_01450 [Archaeoglobaceae archaeon]